MTYEEALRKINGRLRFGVKPGLSRVRELLNRLGNPQKKLKFVHVAGTNGKGTCCALTASVLRESGYVTGLYTSPYVVEFRERFQINGEMISKEELCREVELLSPLVEEFEASGNDVTEFEFITVLAFHWFALRGCDAVVLEVGLGGRFDATNVIDTPEAAVIMSISLDHTAILGDTLEQIAFEKAGIVKPGGEVVLYPLQGPGTTDTIRRICESRGACLHIPDPGKARELSASIDGTDLEVDGIRLHTPFLGEHQVHNAITVTEVVKVLRGRGFTISQEALCRGFERAFLPARMEVIAHRPLCLLDGGHNPGCAKALRDALERFVPGNRVCVMGMLGDKDSREALRLVGPLFSKIVTTAPKNPRALPAEELGAIAREYCENVQTAKDPEEALNLAFSSLREKDALIVWGSFYLAGEVRNSLQKKMKALFGT